MEAPAQKSTTLTFPLHPAFALNNAVSYMDLDVTHPEPSQYVENTNLFELVELLYDYTPRDLKGRLSSSGARLFHPQRHIRPQFSIYPI